MTSPKFIYFDVGGVLVHDLSGRKIIKDLGLNFLQVIEMDRLNDRYEAAACRGEYTDEQIKELIENKLKIKLDPKLKIVELLVSYFEANTRLHPLLKSLQGKYRLGLLTNMNIGMLDIIKRKKMLPDVKWDVVVDSSVVGMVKPEADIYKYAEEQTNYKKEEILFIDNLQVNLKIPKELGWQTFWYDNVDFERSTKDLERLLGE